MRSSTRLAKFKAVTQKQGPLGEIVLTYTKSFQRRDDSDFKSKYIEWLKALHELEALQAKPTAFRAEASTYCGYCFKETGRKFTNHTDADCRRKAGRSKDNDKAPTSDKSAKTSDKGDKTTASGKSDQRGSGRGPWCHICETNGHKTSECPAKAMLLQAVRAVGKGAVATVSDSNESATDGDQYSSASALYLHLATSALSDTSPTPRGDPPLQHETLYRFRVPPLWRTKYSIGDPDLTKPFEVDFKIPRRLPKRARPPSPEREVRGKQQRTALRAALVRVMEDHLSSQYSNKATSHCLKALLASSTTSLATRSTVDSGASMFLTNNRALLGPCKSVMGHIEVADGRILAAPMLEGPVRAAPLPPGLTGLYSEQFQHTLIGVCPLVFDAGHAVVLSKNHGFFCQPDSSCCPICHPAPRRIHFQATPTSLSLDLQPPTSALLGVSSPTAPEGVAAAQHPQVKRAAGTGNDTAPLPAATQQPQSTRAAETAPSHQEHRASGMANQHVEDKVARQTLTACTARTAQQQKHRASGQEHHLTPTDVGTQTEHIPHTHTQWLETWHSRLGGAPFPAILDLARRFPDLLNPPAGIFKADLSRWRCHCCTRANIKRNPAPPAVPHNPALQPLQEVHFDLFFFHETIALFLIDRASRARWCYFLNSKDEVPLKLQQFVVDANTAPFPVGSFHYTFDGSTKHDINAAQVNGYLASKGLTQRVKIFFSDNAGEQTQPLVKDFLRDLGFNNSPPLRNVSSRMPLQNAAAAGASPARCVTTWGLVTCPSRLPSTLSRSTLNVATT